MAIKAPKSKVQAEGKAHNADVSVADKAIAVADKAHRAVEAETGIHEGVTKKTKRIRKRESAGFTYPFTSFVNEYGFMRFSKDLLEDLGWQVKTKINLKVTKTENGIAIERA